MINGHGLGRDRQPDDEVLIGLMADFDEALAADAPTDRLDDTAAELDESLAAEWTGAKECLELIDRVRRRASTAAHSGDASNAEDRLSGKRRLGRFVLERELGRGGLGIVFLAYDQQLGRRVALKIPRFDALLDDELRRRFLREAEAAARLSHPHLVALYDVGEDDVTCYLASEYCPGPTLAQWLRERREPVAARDAAAIVARLAAGVEHAHSRGVLHRDIKPSNVMMIETPGGGAAGWTPKLTDFGMAKLAEHEGADRTRTGAILGTLAYMAPEQLEGRSDVIDARTDVYGLGAVLYELLTGVAPYGELSEAHTLREILAGEPVDPRKRRRDVPVDLESITLKCLAGKPQDRYSTVAEFAADLQRFLDGEPTAARPLGAPLRLVKWTRRRPAIAALWLVSLLAALTAAGLNYRRLIEADQAAKETQHFREAADQQRRRAADEEALAKRLEYISDMRRAQEAWSEGNVERMRELLARYASGSPLAGLRHFEWNHLNYLANLPHQVLRGHVGEAYAVAYSPDGQTLLSGGEDGTLRVWDAHTGESLAVLRGHASCVNSIDFAPDGDTFVTASCDKTIKLWSLRDRKVLATLSGHRQEVDGCVVIGEGKLLASLSRSVTGPREIRLWDLVTRTMRSDWPPSSEILEGFGAARSANLLVTFANVDEATVWKRQGDTWQFSHRLGNIMANAFAVISPDEEYLLVPYFPRSLRTYRLRDGLLMSELREHVGKVEGFALSPTGDRLATASGDGSIGVFEFPSMRPQHRLLGHADRVWQVAWSPDGAKLASAGIDGTIRQWNIGAGSARRELKPPAEQVTPATSVRDIAFLRDGRRLCAGYGDDSCVWDLSTGQCLPPPGDGAGTQSRARHASPEKLEFPAAAYASLSEWDPRACLTPSRIVLVPGALPLSHFCARLLSDGRTLAEFEPNGVRHWTIESLELQQERSLVGLGPSRTVFDISLKGDLLCGLNDDGLFVITSTDGAPTVDLGKIPEATQARFSPDGARLLILGKGLSEYDAHSGAKLRDYSQREISGFAYSADAERIAIASNLGNVAIHDVITGEETLRLAGGGSRLVFTRDGDGLASDGPPAGGVNYWPGRTDSSP